MNARLTQLIPVLFVWIWSTGFINAKYAIPNIEPFYFLTLRFLFTIIAFLFLIWLMKKRWPMRIDIAYQMLIGALIHGAYLGGVFFAIDHGVPAGISSIFVGLHPALTAFLGWVLLKQRLRLIQITGLVLGFLGISLVIYSPGGTSGGKLAIFGIISCIIALVGISYGGILQKQLAEKVPLVSGTLCQYAGGVIVVLPLSLALETHEVNVNFEMVAALVWSVFALSIGAVLLLMYMIREGEVSKVASYFYLVPPATVLQAYFLFDEQLGLTALFGCTLAVIGVYLITARKRPKRPCSHDTR
jgi:drug/metabolite transporter (DMT)-like permease